MRPCVLASLIGLPSLPFALVQMSSVSLRGMNADLRSGGAIREVAVHVAAGLAAGTASFAVAAVVVLLSLAVGSLAGFSVGVPEAFCDRPSRRWVLRRGFFLLPAESACVTWYLSSTGLTTKPFSESIFAIATIV